MNKYPTRLRILQQFGSHTAYFSSVEDGSKVLDDLAVQLAKIKEFSNRDEEPIFRFRGAGAFYAIDLRKVTGASLELVDEWGDVLHEESLRNLVRHKSFRLAADERGLADELDRLETRRTALADAG
jgi:hypothetical protein